MNAIRDCSPLLLRRIKHAAGLGNTSAQMAKRFKRDEASVLDICRQHGIAICGVSPPPGRAAAPQRSAVSIKLETGSLTALQLEAGRRGTTAPLLAGEMLDLIIKDGLYAAVLD